MQAAVSLQHIAKHYVQGGQRSEVLGGLDLEVEAGEFVALMGPSGAGKTTLLNLVGGFTRADAGTVQVLGVMLDQLGASQLASWRASQVGLVPQVQKLSPWLTVEQNVELPLRLTGRARGQCAADVEAALQLVGMSARRACDPCELSGGEQQRVALARALVADPALLLCDEPTGALDRDTAHGILDLLELLNQAMGTTILMVTHDRAAAGRAGRRLHLEEGRLQGAGEAACAGRRGRTPGAGPRHHA